MRFAIKFISVISLSAVIGVSLGLMPELAKNSTAALTKQGHKSQHRFRSRFNQFSVSSPAHRTLAVKGIFQIGDPEVRNEVRAQHIKITANDGFVVVDKEIGRVDVPAKTHGKDYPFDLVFSIPSGWYEVDIFSHTPGHTRTEIDGTVGPLIHSRHTVEVHVD